MPGVPTNGTRRRPDGARVGQPAGLGPVPEGDPAAVTISAHPHATGWHPLKDGDVVALADRTVLFVRVQVREEA